MDEMSLGVYEVTFFTFSGVEDSVTYRAEDEDHAVEIFEQRHPGLVAQMVYYHGEA